jgi:hypothetical protein
MFPSEVVSLCTGKFVADSEVLVSLRNVGKLNDPLAGTHPASVRCLSTSDGPNPGESLSTSIFLVVSDDPLFVGCGPPKRMSL